MELSVAADAVRSLLALWEADMQFTKRLILSVLILFSIQVLSGTSEAGESVERASRQVFHELQKLANPIDRANAILDTMDSCPGDIGWRDSLDSHETSEAHAKLKADIISSHHLWPTLHQAVLSYRRQNQMDAALLMGERIIRHFPTRQNSREYSNMIKIFADFHLERKEYAQAIQWLLRKSLYADGVYFDDAGLNDLYFKTLHEHGKEMFALPWMHTLTEASPFMMGDGQKPIVYTHPNSPNNREGKIMFRAPEGYVFSKINLQGDVEIHEDPKGNVAYFVYLEPYFPIRQVGRNSMINLVYSQPGYHLLDTDHSLSESWPFLHARLFSSDANRKIYQWQINAEFEPGNAVSLLRELIQNPYAKVKGRVHVNVWPEGSRYSLDNQDHDHRRSIATSLQPGWHTGHYRSPQGIEQEVPFFIQGNGESEVGLNFESGWQGASVTLPQHVGRFTLAEINYGSYLAMATKQVDTPGPVYSWYSSDLSIWEPAETPPVGERLLRPQLIRTNAGTLMLFTLQQESSSLQLTMTQSHDGKNWSALQTLPPLPETQNLDPPCIAELPSGFLLVIMQKHFTIGLPGRWRPWKLLDISASRIKPCALLGDHRLCHLVFQGQHEDLRYVVSSDGIQWSQPIPIEINRKSNSKTEYRLLQQDDTLWLLADDNYVKGWYYSWDDQVWNGPVSLPLRFGDYLSQVIECADGTHAALYQTAKHRNNYLPSIMQGRFPSFLHRFENTYRWEDLSKGSCVQLINGQDEIWFVNPYYGFSRFDKNTTTCQDLGRTLSRDGTIPPRSTVGAITTHQDQVFVAINGYGVELIDRSTGKSEGPMMLCEPQRSQALNALAWASERLWIGTTQGLESCLPNTGTLEVHSWDYAGDQGPYITALAPAENGVWLATNEGEIYRFRLASEVFHKGPQLFEDIGRINKLISRGEDLYIVGRRNIALYNTQTGDVRMVLHNSQGDVDDATVDERWLWYLNQERLWRYDPAQQIHEEILVRTPLYESMMGPSTWSVVVDDRYVYLSLYGGMTRGEKAKLNLANRD